MAERMQKNIRINNEISRKLVEIQKALGYLSESEAIRSLIVMKHEELYRGENTEDTGNRA